MDSITSGFSVWARSLVLTLNTYTPAWMLDTWDHFELTEIFPLYNRIKYCQPEKVLLPPGLCVIDDVIVEQGAGVEHLADDGDLFLQIRDPGRVRGLQAES